MSYYKILGMEKEPFSTSPDPEFFYASHEHKTALLKTMIEVRLKRGLSVILGDVGTGKTTLCRKLLQLFSERSDIMVFMILDPSYKSEEVFLHELVRSFGIETEQEHPSAEELKDAIKNFLFDQAVEENRTIVLIIDEAQKMSIESLEILRTLLNYETNNFKLLQLILVGQLELQEQLKNMRNLVDRIGYKCVLDPLVDVKETRDLITFRVTKAGRDPKKRLFDDAAIEEIFKTTNGFPRRIGMLCHNALRELVSQSKNHVTYDMIHNMAADETVV